MVYANGKLVIEVCTNPDQDNDIKLGKRLVKARLKSAELYGKLSMYSVSHTYGQWHVWRKNNDDPTNQSLELQMLYFPMHYHSFIDSVYASLLQGLL